MSGNGAERYDVVVAGAGPVGLMLAAELALRGVRTLVVERLTEPSTTIKAGSINTLTAEAAYRHGLLPKLAEVQETSLAMLAEFAKARGAAKGDSPADPVEQPARPKVAGHFAGIFVFYSGEPGESDPATEFDLAGEPSPASNVVLVHQQAVESIVGEWAVGLGAELRRGAELVGLADDGSGVTVELATGELIRTSWLVGCDGGRSTVRKLVRFDFPGTEPTIVGHQAIVDIADPDKLPTGWTKTATGMLVHGPVPGRILTVEFDGPPIDRDAPITLEELQTSLRDVSGTDVTITGVRSATRFTDHARQVSDYRSGRVLLAGDAAHVHSPFGGQGLNLGVGDAVNLGWKLAANVNGWASEDLLDTYTAERHPVGAWVLDWNRAQVALMRPGPHTDALREVVSDLIHTPQGTTYLAKKLSGLWIRYDLGGGHDLVGRRSPDLEFADGSRLGEHFRDGRPLLVDLGGRPAEGGPAERGLGELAAGWRDRITVLDAACPKHPELTGLLVRPDGYVAWAAGETADDEGLVGALTRWFGAPTPAVVTVG